jgi:hypothetical protein
MLAAGYLFVPAQGVSSPLPAPPSAKAAAPARQEAPQAQAKPTIKLVTNRPPVPLVTPPRTSYFEPQQATADSPSAQAPGDNNAPGQAGALTATAAGGDGSAARRAIEFDGYRNVRGLEKGPDGMWHGRAMRGRTEIAVRVDASGNVSAE